MLLEQIIANDPTLQPYEYINTEIAEDGQRLILHLASRKDIAEEKYHYSMVMYISWAARA